ncbi:hypothetical protein P7K49_015792 [Saguinus oedipus]|uniref:Uncharacterized protein n=1 Tax=Saguinus oedipus TaxID=9490 RepID=A0ABQ9VA87_SAGOE|nr:hypothetical protein P7K49_015792 [Saguinus oedipus]
MRLRPGRGGQSGRSLSTSEAASPRDCALHNRGLERHSGVLHARPNQTRSGPPRPACARPPATASSLPPPPGSWPVPDMAALYACTKCHQRFPFEALSQGQQLCKVRGLGRRPGTGDAGGAARSSLFSGSGRPARLRSRTHPAGGAGGARSRGRRVRVLSNGGDCSRTP